MTKNKAAKQLTRRLRYLGDVYEYRLKAGLNCSTAAYREAEGLRTILVLVKPQLGPETAADVEHDLVLWCLTAQRLKEQWAKESPVGCADEGLDAAGEA